MEPETLEDKHLRLALRWTAWHFWRGRRSDTGELGDLYATRIAHITDDLVNQGLHRTLPLGSGHNSDLEEQLEAQAELEITIGYATEKVLL